MIGIIVVGHNQFAYGVTSTVEMIAGKQEQYEAVDFLDGTSHEALYESLGAALERVRSSAGVLIFTDLKGGTPFQQAAMHAMQSEYPVEVLTGTNIAMLLEGTLMRHTTSDVRALSEKLVQTGLEQVSRFDADGIEHDKHDDFEDGI